MTPMDKHIAKVDEGDMDFDFKERVDDNIPTTTKNIDPSQMHLDLSFLWKRLQIHDNVPCPHFWRGDRRFDICKSDS